MADRMTRLVVDSPSLFYRAFFALPRTITGPDGKPMKMRIFYNAGNKDREQLAALVLIMDSRRPFTELDVQMLEWFAPTGKPIHCILTKADKLTRNEAVNVLRQTQGAPQASRSIQSGKAAAQNYDVRHRRTIPLTAHLSHLSVRAPWSPAASGQNG